MALQIDQPEDILSRFLLEREKDPSEMSVKYLRDIMLTFVVAGKDTTSGTLSWFFFMLCTQPSVQEKVYREVKDVVDDAESLEDFATGITEAALSAMNYLRAALSETLRLYPAIPLDSKMCFEDDQLPGGLDVRKGEVVTYQPYAMGRMKYLWGEDAEEFRPERWLDEQGVYRHESPYKFTAFQAGPRLCMGRDFAYRQMMVFAAVLVRFFVFELGENGKAVKYKPMLTLYIDGGLGLRAFGR
ncbi:cytochrome P450 704C1-like [Wolffia australiana]